MKLRAVEKVFNWSEFYLSEMTCYKIYTLVDLTWHDTSNLSPEGIQAQANSKGSETLQLLQSTELELYKIVFDKA